MSKVLVIDDDRGLTRVVDDWLTHEGHTICVVNTGSEGWEQIQSDQYDIVVLDWDMPDIRGIDILQRARQSGSTVPIILLTGHTSIDDKERGFDSGADDYLTKPFNIKELALRIQNVLRLKKTAPEVKPIGQGNEEILKRAELAGTALAARYEFLELIGEGGFAFVFKARHPQLDKMVAIKMLHAKGMTEESIARFEREARAISRLDHPSIITVHDFGTTERAQPYMVMEFIAGKSLRALLQENDLLPLNNALDILVPIGDALALAHEHKILHRDIKPPNIMLKESPGRPTVPKILDFGLAKLIESDAGSDVELTKAQQIVGSPAFMSPEQVKGQPLDERSDIYSFACVVFETTTGYPPHTGKTAPEIMYKHLQEPPFTYEEVRPDSTFPAELKALVSKALEKDPDKRYQSMRELRNDLEGVQTKLRVLDR